MTKGGGAKKPMNAKKVAKIVEDKTFGMKNKGGKKNQAIAKQMQASLSGSQRKAPSGNSGKQPLSKKQLKAEREEELARLGLNKTIPKKTAATPSSSNAMPSSSNAVDGNPLPDDILEDNGNLEGRMLEDKIEEMRRNLGANLTPVTKETFAIWYAKKKKEKQEKRLKKMSKREKDIALGRVAMTGKELFERKRGLFVDDERADDTSYERDEDLLAGYEEQLRMNAEANGEEFDAHAFAAERDKILAKLKEDRVAARAMLFQASSSSSSSTAKAHNTNSSTTETSATGAIDASLFTADDLPDDEELEEGDEAGQEEEEGEGEGEEETEEV